MKRFLVVDFYRKIEKNQFLQFLIGVGSISLISLVSYLFIEIIGYHVVALLLLLAVSVLAMFFKILPILSVAVISALTWNFLFIQPRSTFNISTPEDALLFLMYFVIAVMNAVFTTKIRKAESAARKRKQREKTIQLYNTLLNSLSHELRTPISAIIGSVDTLKENQDRLTEANQNELYTEIEIAGNRLNRQVSNLLNMSRLESDFINLQLDWYDINEIIHKIIRNNLSENNTHEIRFESNENLPLFKLDSTLIEQILQNIIHNAIQYTPEGTIIKIRANFAEENLIMEIEDNGKGFPQDKIQAVFEKFYRLPNTVTGGTGLGLSIAKGFAQAHNGNISLQNRPGGGAHFIITIPIQSSYLKPFEDE